MAMVVESGARGKEARFRVYEARAWVRGSMGRVISQKRRLVVRRRRRRSEGVQPKEVSRRRHEHPKSSATRRVLTCKSSEGRDRKQFVRGGHCEDQTSAQQVPRSLVERRCRRRTSSLHGGLCAIATARR